MGRMMTQEAQQTLRRLACHKRQGFSAHRMEEVIRSFRESDSTLGWGLLSEGKSPIPITDPRAWHAYASSLYDVSLQSPPDISSMPRPTTCQLFTAQNVWEALGQLHTQRAHDHEGLQTEHSYTRTGDPRPNLSTNEG